jgi:hypothetical protein
MGRESIVIRPDRGKWCPKLGTAARLTGLIGGFAAGQGSVFLVQTWLIAQGRAGVVASFGLAIAILSLAQWAADWGGLVLLSGMQSKSDPFRPVRIANAARSIVAAPIIGGVVSFALLYVNDDPLSAGILFGGVGVAVVGSLNIAGLLDAHQKNGLVGLTAGLPWIGGAVGLLVYNESHYGLLTGGIVVGALYACGFVLHVAVQYLVLCSVIKLEYSGRITRDEIREYLIKGGSIYIGDFPGQVYGRALILIVSANLGSDAAGVYIYVRQVFSACAQIIVFGRRTEIRALVRIASLRKTLDRYFLSAITVTMLLSAFIVCVSGILFLSRQYLPTRFAEVSLYLFFFSATLPIWVLSSALGYLLIWIGWGKTYSAVTLCTLCVSVLVVVLFVGQVGLSLIPLCDFVMLSAQGFFFAYYWSAQRAGTMCSPISART